MPRCLECGNTTRFSYMENSYNEATYDVNGSLEDVTYKSYDPVTDAKCMQCESSNVEGEL